MSKLYYNEINSFHLELPIEFYVQYSFLNMFCNMTSN